jgi:hypothetical protein
MRRCPAVENPGLEHTVVRLAVSVRAELVEALSFPLINQEGRPFDRLRASGFR